MLQMQHQAKIVLSEIVASDHQNGCVCVCMWLPDYC